MKKVVTYATNPPTVSYYYKSPQTDSYLLFNITELTGTKRMMPDQLVKMFAKRGCVNKAGKRFELIMAAVKAHFDMPPAEGI